MARQSAAINWMWILHIIYMIRLRRSSSLKAGGLGLLNPEMFKLCTGMLCQFLFLFLFFIVEVQLPVKHNVCKGKTNEKTMWESVFRSGSESQKGFSSVFFNYNVSHLGLPDSRRGPI